MKGLFFILSLSVCSLFHPAMAQYRSEVWVSDEGNGMYRNPVLHADYSDPDVCAVGGDYFLTASSFKLYSGTSYPAFKGFSKLENRELCLEEGGTGGIL